MMRRKRFLGTAGRCREAGVGEYSVGEGSLAIGAEHKRGCQLFPVPITPLSDLAFWRGTGANKYVIDGYGDRD
jgi:hypothetical protein